MLLKFNRTTLLLFFFILFSKIILAQSDVCSTPTALNPGTTCSTTPGTLFNAGDESTIASSCATSTYDVWYSFTTPGGCDEVSIDITPIGNGGNNITSTKVFVEGFSGTSCSPILIGACTPVGTTLTLPNLDPNTTYYLRVFANTNPNTNSTRWDYDICITYALPPANDECAGAVTLTNGVTINNGTVWKATTSAGIPAGCATGTPDDDVWYKITPTNTTLDVTLSAVGVELSTSGTRLQLFTGACNSLVSVACGTNSLSASVVNGNPYYIRVYSAGAGSIGGTASGSAFSITATVSGSPSNDDCSGAITLSSGVANNTGTVWLATASSGIPSDCVTGDPDDDVWYKFTPAGNSLSVSLSAIGTNLNTSGVRLQLFSGTCGSLSSVACGTNSLVSAVTMGNVYYLRVYSAGTGSPGGVASGSAFTITASSTAPNTVNSSRMKEVYQQTILSPASALADPWEITYGNDNYLWITEAKGYKVYRMHPVTGVKTTVLDISQNSTFFSSPADQAFNVQFSSTQSPWPQGGMAGLALHPNFMHPSTPENYVYISYVHSYNGGSSPTGIFFTNRLVRFTYNTATNRLESPVSLCDTLPGSNDHNSQRIIITPVGGTNYLFYASGDMGAGQFSNKDRPNRSQNSSSYEGKILRFNLVPDVDAGLSAWIPNDNPYSATSAVWTIGVRNNQGFAYDSTTGILYGSSHGPYSDDEINIIQPSKNYGHPIVIGYSADNNYNNSSAGAANTTSSCPLIVSETGNASAIGSSYKDPLFSAYAASQSVISNIWTTNPSNGGWPSEGWSGMDIYKNTIIPGWKNSLVIASLKWGRVLRLKMNDAGTSIIPTGAYDTVSYFGSTNRFRDIAFSPDGKDMFVIMDRSSTTSGPSAGNPVVPACGGCVQKYTFLGYADAGGKSSIPSIIDVTQGVLNNCTTGTSVTIDNSNNNLWVPLTGPDGNIMAEINAMGQNLGLVSSSFYTHSGSTRNKNGFRYLNRNITITPAVSNFSTPVKVRLYISKAEFDLLDADPLSGITSGIGQLKILKNNDPCGPALINSTQEIAVTISDADRLHGTNGYVLQGEVTGFSSFYFGATNITLPLELITFRGSLQNNATLLQWETINESNASHFDVERSIDGRNFDRIGMVSASGTSNHSNQYSHFDYEVNNLAATTIYYRLKMMDDDGRYTYSSVVSIQLGDISNRVILSPNPTTGDTRLLIASAREGKAVWRLTDNNGRVVLKQSVDIHRGNNNVSLNVSGLKSGLYYLHISGAGINQHLKLQKL